MYIIQRYIIKNVIVSTALIFMVVLALCFVTGMLRELNTLGEGDYGFLQVFLHELLLLPHAIYQFFPMLVLLGGVVGLGMLAANHELMVFRASGVSVSRIVFAVINAALILIVISTLIGEWVAPRANYFAEKHKSLALSFGQAVVTLSGVWIHEGNNFIHIDRVIGRHHLQGVTRYEFDDKHHLLAAYSAESLDFKNNQWMAHELMKTAIMQDKTQSEYFPLATWDLNLTPNLLNVGLVEAEAMSLVKLKEYTDYLIKNQMQATAFQLSYWQRIFQPITTLVMLLLAVPFVFASPRSSTMGKRILLAVIIGFVFHILNAFLGEFSVVFQFPPIIAAALPTILFAMIGIGWLWRVRV